MKCIEDEIPFDVPEGWEWCNLGLLFNHNTGKALNSSNTKGTSLTYITTSNVYWDHFELDDLKMMPFTDDEVDKCTVKKGDLLVCEGGDIGRSAIWDYEYDIRIQNHIHRLRPYDNICIKFYYYTLYIYKINGMINGQGIGLQGLSSNRLHSIMVPLPPISEQERISSCIEAFFNKIDNLENEKESLNDLIGVTKSKVLDLAIRGKLVPQNPDDEPASVLLERIRSEKEELIKQGKLKRDKKESIIYKGDDNSYYLQTNSHSEKIEKHFMFDLPNGWTWCVLQNVARSELGKTLDQVKNTGRLLPYLRSVNIKWDDVDLSDLNQMRFEDEEIERYTVKKGDLLICEGGDVGRSAIWNSNGNILYQNALHRVRFRLGINPRFFMYYLMYYESKGILKEICKGVTIKHLTGNVLNSIPFALPPLNEQNRIVDMIDDSFKIINELL